MRLWAIQSFKPVERKRNTWAAIAFGGAGTAMAGGLGYGAYELSKNKGKSNGGEFGNYVPPMTPEQIKLEEEIWRQIRGGFPELDQAFNTQWGDFRKGLSEEYQARRGMQPLGTPEISQMAQARATGQAGLAGTKLTAQQNLYNMLRGLVRQPTTTYTPQGPSGMEQFATFAAPLASTALSGYLQGQTWKDIMGGGANKISPKFTPYEENVMKQPDYPNLSQLLPYLAMMGAV